MHVVPKTDQLPLLQKPVLNKFKKQGNQQIWPLPERSFKTRWRWRKNTAGLIWASLKTIRSFLWLGKNPIYDGEDLSAAVQEVFIDLFNKRLISVEFDVNWILLLKRSFW